MAFTAREHTRTELCEQCLSELERWKLSMSKWTMDKSDSGAAHAAASMCAETVWPSMVEARRGGRGGRGEVKDSET